LLVGLTSTTAADKPKDLIVGKWQMPDRPTVFEFTKAGAVKITSKEKKDVELTGKYRFISDDTVEVTIDYDGKPETDTFQIVEISKDAMTTVDKSKARETLRRVK
jgi:uncharacterized protein (TIGR03066 family)